MKPHRSASRAISLLPAAMLMPLTAAYAQAPATADTPSENEVLRSVRERLDEQDRRLKAQEDVIRQLRDEIERLQSANHEAQATTEAGRNALPLSSATELEQTRAAGTPANVMSASPASAPAAPPPSANPDSSVLIAQQRAGAAAAALPSGPVGEAPQPAQTADVAALPEGARVLTSKGIFIAESSVEYDRTSSSRLVFRGVEIVPGIQLGLVDANDVARDAAVATFDVRYGLFDRAEVELRVPYMYRHDRLTVLSQQVSPSAPPATQMQNLEGHHWGDVELSGRYQLNRALEGGPVYVAGLRIKSATGLGPYDVRFDGDGVAKELGTGSGFWAVEPSLTFLVPSDPVVIFGNLGYLFNFKRNINKDIGIAHLGEATPGDSIDLSVGFGFAINPQFSFSLGFSNTYIFANKVQLGATTQTSRDLEAASLTMGMSYLFSPVLALSSNFEFGMTSDAPDLRVLLRLPYRF